MAAAGQSPLICVRDVHKEFPGVKALRGVSLELGVGEVLAVVGENGAGKSTLMKILAGVQRQDSGEILIDGQEVEMRSVNDALKLGISLIHQELNLADNLDVAANIFLGREFRNGAFINTSAQYAAAAEYLTAVGLDVKPQALVGTLPIGKQQLVEIAKALSIDARVLIMDEPTSSLSTRETETLFEVIRNLKSRGVSVVYISHRLSEVRELADRVTVLRDGENAGELTGETISHDNLVKLMVGREVSQFYPHQPHAPGESVMRVRNLCTRAHPTKEVSFELFTGEIVGMAGLVGAGRTEVLEAIFGVTPALAGGIHLRGGEGFLPKVPREAIACGMALVPEDRKQQGLILEMAVRENVSLASLERDQHRGFLDFQAERRICTEMIQKMRIRTPGAEQVVLFLSGGNQQKVVLGKWLAMKPKVLLLDEPTRGIDVGAKSEIYGLMEQLAAEGVAILFVSSDMEELLGMSDRTLVMHEGNLSGELSRDELSEEAIMQLATGGAARAA